MAVITRSLKSRAVGVLAAAAVWIIALVGPVGAAPTVSGGGGTGTQVPVPVGEPEGVFSLPPSILLAALVFGCAVLSVAVYRRYHRTAVASG